MKVLKFGGSSVSDANNINKVIQILNDTAKNSQVVVVVSAFGKTTNKLIEAAKHAAHKNESYKEILHEIEQHHLDVAKELIPISNQSADISHIKR